MLWKPLLYTTFVLKHINLFQNQKLCFFMCFICTTPHCNSIVWDFAIVGERSATNARHFFSQWQSCFSDSSNQQSDKHTRNTCERETSEKYPFPVIVVIKVWTCCVRNCAPVRDFNRGHLTPVENFQGVIIRSLRVVSLC
jgi:hypothetical protein